MEVIESCGSINEDIEFLRIVYAISFKSPGKKDAAAQLPLFTFFDLLQGLRVSAHFIRTELTVK